MRRIFTTVWRLLGIGGTVHFAWFTLGVGAVVGTGVSAVISSVLQLSWWWAVPLFLGVFLLAAGATGVALQAASPWLRSRGIRIGSEPDDLPKPAPAEAAATTRAKPDPTKNAKVMSPPALMGVPPVGRSSHLTEFRAERKALIDQGQSLFDRWGKNLRHG